MAKLAANLVGVVCKDASSPVVNELKQQFTTIWDGRNQVKLSMPIFR